MNLQNLLNPNFTGKVEDKQGSDDPFVFLHELGHATDMFDKTVI